MNALPGFRDFYPQSCAVRNYIFESWRRVLGTYGYVEYDAPLLESTELYRKKSGDEILNQLFYFTDKGEREVALRPELTPSLARMVISQGRLYKLPLKWFSVGQFFRYEKQQRGRQREFYQLNCDLIGREGCRADAELLSIAVDVLRDLGLSAADVVVRVSDRKAWARFLSYSGVSESNIPTVLQLVDKLEKDDSKKIQESLASCGIGLDELRRFIDCGGTGFFEDYELLRADMESRGLADFIELDPSVVRGLAYYTGMVFEVFDRQKKLRAVAGGGRYDGLLPLFSDGKLDWPAVGFGMGDVVLLELIRQTPGALKKMELTLQLQSPVQVYAVIASEEHRGTALSLIQQLRDQGFRVDYDLQSRPVKVHKQFQLADASGAPFAVVFGDEWPQVRLKDLKQRSETVIAAEKLLSYLRDRVSPSRD